MTGPPPQWYIGRCRRVTKVCGQFETILTKNKTTGAKNMKSMQATSIRRLAEAGLIAAMYTVLTMLFTFSSFGVAQFRVAEMLTILPLFTPAAIPGLAVGCLVANLFGLMSGGNLLGAWDLVLGPLATLLAALATRRLGGIRWKGLPVLATLPPVILNAVAVGWELTYVLFDFSWPLYGINALQVAAGQTASCVVCGLLLFVCLEKSGASRVLFGQTRVHTAR